MKNGGAFLFTSRTAAKEEVSTILLMDGVLVAACRIERTPLMAGIMSSFSLSLVL